jgi:predicted GNAT superfamily acetyltransferase
MAEWTIRPLESPEEMSAIEALQRLVWPGSETDVIPAHMLLAVVHNGGLALGAFAGEKLVGVSFAFPGYYSKPGNLSLKLHSHILGVHPDWEGMGIGFSLKRAQRHVIREQGIDLVTWTFDPLLSRNAHLNIARLGSVCNTYLRSEYGEMRDSLNFGLPSDRFQVDWWLNTERVEQRLGQLALPTISIDRLRSAGAKLVEATLTHWRLPSPPMKHFSLSGSLLLVEIPSDFPTLKSSDLALANGWRRYSRDVFEQAFSNGYLVTDFIHEKSRSFYLLTNGANPLQDDAIYANLRS